MSPITLDLDEECGGCPGCLLQAQCREALGLLDEMYLGRLRRLPIPRLRGQLEAVVGDADSFSPPYFAEIDRVAAERETARHRLENTYAGAECYRRSLIEEEWPEDVVVLAPKREVTKPGYCPVESFSEVANVG